MYVEKSGEKSRIIIGALLPVPVSLLCLTVVLQVGPYNNPEPSFSDPWGNFIGLVVLLTIYLVGGYVLMGLQSLAYSMVMELGINRWIENDIVALVASAGAGAVAGALFLPEPFTKGLIIAGAIVGAVTGVPLRFWYRKSLRRGQGES